MYINKQVPKMPGKKWRNKHPTKHLWPLLTDTSPTCTYPNLFGTWHSKSSLIHLYTWMSRVEMYERRLISITTFFLLISSHFADTSIVKNLSKPSHYKTQTICKRTNKQSSIILSIYRIVITNSTTLQP